MASGGNRKRNRKRANGDRSLWGFLFKKEEEGEDFMHRSFFQDEEEEPPRFSPTTMLSLLWQKFNFWYTLAVVLFLTFTALLFSLLFPFV